MRRRALLIRVGETTARLLTLVAAQRHGQLPAFGFDRNLPILDQIVLEYFSQVDSFKEENGFKNGDLINFSKVAGLFTTILLDKDLPGLFIVPKDLTGSLYAGLLKPVFIYLLIGACLRLDLRRIDGEVEADLLRCLTLHPEIRIDRDWLFWSLRVLQIAFDDPLPTTSGDSSLTVPA
ncbi:hypothetical protein [Azospirillum thermophilum]|uniref:Uncharacterized protein n=1 Tax=Azospirillum thermophilum TaxID=2202148 RepID=A0A2S2CTE0_9PROT|nr:hypothetical protein [Azospirillum thermophilum]AWK87772.1 hypothetical protein DEW08_17645 [Azospirillum thermophilum]